MNTAQKIIEALGGPKVAARVCGVDLSRIYRWQMPPSKGGTGGLIPTKHHIKILEFASASNLPITPHDFVPDYSQFQSEQANSEDLEDLASA